MQNAVELSGHPQRRPLRIASQEAHAWQTRESESFLAATGVEKLKRNDSAKTPRLMGDSSWKLGKKRRLVGG